MWLQVFGVMGGTYVPSTEPSVASVSVSLTDGGSCSGTHVGSNGKVTATYAISNPSWTAYTVKVYRENVLSQTLTSAGTTTDVRTTPGVAGDPHHVVTVHWIWRVDVIRNADGHVVSTKTATTYSDTFGDCNGSA